MATMAYVTKQLNKWGEGRDGDWGNYIARRYHWEIEATAQDGICLHLRARRITDEDKPNEDYCAGEWFDTVKAAITFATAMINADVKQVQEFIETGETRGVPAEFLMRKAAFLQSCGAYSAA